MADELIKKCDNPKCLTPYEDVLRLTSDLEREGAVVIDVCKPDRENVSIMEIRSWAHKRLRRRGIKVTEPNQVRRAKS